MKFRRDVENLIACFRGLPEDRSVATMREATPIDSLIETLFEQYRINKPTVEQVIMTHWKELVGEFHAHRSIPQRIVNGKTLVVAVSNAVARQELQFRLRDVLARLRKIPGCNSIQEIVLRAG